MVCGRHQSVRNVKAKEDEGEQEEEEKEEEYRISDLSDDLIGRILSMNRIDAKDAVQTSLFSTRWRHIWKCLSHLNFDRSRFPHMSSFTNFVTKFLSNRNPNSDLITINLTCPPDTGVTAQSLIRKIALYAASQNAQTLNICADVSVPGLPPSIFNSQSLKQLRLSSLLRENIAPKSPWILPALTTLFLHGVSFESSRNCKSINLFSSLLNLKNLSLIDCRTSGLEVFHIVSLQIEYFALTISRYWRCPSEFVVSAPRLSTFEYKGHRAPLISGNELHCLDKVYIDIELYNLYGRFGWRRRVFQEIILMFHLLRDVMFLTITIPTLELLNWVIELLENQPSPFHKLKCLKIVDGGRMDNSTVLSARVITYLCNSSPCSAIINE